MIVCALCLGRSKSKNKSTDSKEKTASSAKSKQVKKSSGTEVPKEHVASLDTESSTSLKSTPFTEDVDKSM